MEEGRRRYEGSRMEEEGKRRKRGRGGIKDTSNCRCNQLKEVVLKTPIT